MSDLTPEMANATKIAASPYADSDRFVGADYLVGKASISVGEIRALVSAARERDALLKENEHLRELNARWHSRVSHYESAVCFSPPRPYALPTGAVTGNIETERVSAVIDERDALREQCWARDKTIEEMQTQAVFARDERDALQADMETERDTADRWAEKARVLQAEVDAARTAHAAEGRRKLDAEAEVERLRGELEDALEALRPFAGLNEPAPCCRDHARNVVARHREREGSDG